MKFNVLFAVSVDFSCVDTVEFKKPSFDLMIDE
jgi:hypothetical protein